MWRLMVIITIVIVDIFIILNYMYKKTNDYKNSQIDIKGYLRGVPYNLQIVNFGSTYSKFAFGTYEDLNLNGHDLSLQAQSLEMDNEILKQYVGHLAPGCVVVVVAAACLLLFREKGDNLLYYKVLDKEHNPHYSLGGKIKSIFPLLAHPKKIKKIIKDTKLIENVYELCAPYMQIEDSEREMKDLVDVWKKLFLLPNMKQTDFSYENINIMEHNCGILAEMLDFCKNRDLVPIVVVPPFSNRLNRYFSDEFKTIVIRNNIISVTKNRNIPFLDYQDDEEFQNAPELFADGGFRLNKRGSKILFNRLVTDLHDYGIELTNATIGIRWKG